jgi:hypothetical protein
VCWSLKKIATFDSLGLDLADYSGLEEPIAGWHWAAMDEIAASVEIVTFLFLNFKF